MNDLTEAVGDVAQGALAARAAEPVAGEADGHTHESACLNCATPLVGSHCHACGQAAHVHKTLGAFFHDLLHGVLHFEGKVWRTLPALVWKPGKLTREYIDGRRASYVSPIALFLFLLFAVFAVVKTFGPDITNATDVEVNGEHIRGLEANRAELARLREERARLAARNLPTDAIDGEIEGREEGVAIMEAIRNPASGVADDDDVSGASFITGIAALDHAVSEVRANPQLAVLKLQTNAYKFAWLLIPISVPFVWLLFPFSRRFGLYDHTVFVTYSLCFMMLLLMVTIMGAAAGISGMAALFMVIAPLHIYKQVRGTYDKRRISALWRTLALCAYAMVALNIFGLGLLALLA